MKLKIFILVLLFVQSSMSATNTKMWYDKPAGEWMQALPVGNGRLGAMVYGGIDVETLALNETSMWAGEYDPNQENAFGKEKLKELRQLFFDGKLIEGNKLAGKYLSGKSKSFGTHLPVGDLKVKFYYAGNQPAEKYKRTLDMSKGLHTMTYKAGDVTYVRECFSSNPDDVLVMRISADKKGAITADLSLGMLREPCRIFSEGNDLCFNGQALFPKQGKGGVLFDGRIRVKTNGGSVSSNTGTLRVESANEVLIYIDIRTNYNNEKYEALCKKNLDKAASKSFNKLKSCHIKDFSSLFDRVNLNFGQDSMMEIPTDERWRRFKANPSSDPNLIAMFFQYARYLIMSSSRENSPLPAALQGLFNDNLACNMCWTCDYHLDINTQQNYWITNVGNLAECNRPLFKYISHLAEYGEKTAAKVYGCKGWTAHTVANIWGFTAPSPGIGYGLFPTASSWLASHLWTEYEYTQNKDFLKKVAYPLLRGNAEFLLDYMTETPDGKYLVTGPSISPENMFMYQGKRLCASMMPTCDRVLAYETFNSTLKSAEILKTDKEFQTKLKAALSKLPPIRFTKKGGVREWFEDYQEAMPNHRHTTHLLSLYPFSQISVTKTPELANGALSTINGRLSAKGWEDVEWSRANMICFYSRLKKPQEAFGSIHILMRDLCRENLMSISPRGIAGAPYDIFILDGNTAGAAGISEMLVQSHEGYIEFLPCIPKELKNGECRGLCVRGGAVVDIKWNDQAFEKAVVYANASNEYAIKLDGNQKNYKILLNGKITNLKQDGKGIVRIRMKKKDKLRIVKI